MVRVLRKVTASPIKVSKAHPEVFKMPKKDCKMSKGFQGKLSHASLHTCSSRSIYTRYFIKNTMNKLTEHESPRVEINISLSSTKITSLESKLIPIEIEIPSPEANHSVADGISSRLCKSEPEDKSHPQVPNRDSQNSSTKFQICDQVNLDYEQKEVKLEQDSVEHTYFETQGHRYLHSGAVLEPDMVPYYETEVLITETEVIAPKSDSTVSSLPPKLDSGTPVSASTKSPHTVISPLPHKIQLGACINDVVPIDICHTPSSALSSLHISETAKRAGKPRRRLNPSQTSNQLASLRPGQKPSSRMTKKELAALTSHKLTDYFPIRRSERKTKRTVLEEKQMMLEKAVKAKLESGLQVCNFEGKGRGIVATQEFFKGDFVVEYSGELIDMSEAKAREHIYTQDQNTGCYMYYFKYKNDQYCIDATVESGRLGRLVNHSRNGNLTTKTVPIEGKPHLVLIAKQHIAENEEVLYDYGDRSKESLVNHPWLNL